MMIMNGEEEEEGFKMVGIFFIESVIVLWDLFIGNFFEVKVIEFNVL